jgi:hypothetical protein
MVATTLDCGETLPLEGDVALATLLKCLEQRRRQPAFRPPASDVTSAHPERGGTIEKGWINFT